MTGPTAHAYDAAVLGLESRPTAPAPSRGSGRRSTTRARRPADALPADLGVALANLQAAGLAPEIVDLTDATDTPDVIDADAARAS